MSGQLPPIVSMAQYLCILKYGAPVVMPGSNQYAAAMQPGDVRVHEASHLSGTPAATSQIGLPPAGGIANPEVFTKMNYSVPMAMANNLSKSATANCPGECSSF
ncbi:hypothetical protein EB796_025010 [Bugula neritina]|uniref:Uncharacterized protein n=1 Tax=Bugula neritina TaxID=10212 RepID=A0A7J7IRW6_BUGNE|nr:hypothetical protein EB796_025010 [Bugula neritina]